MMSFGRKLKSLRVSGGLTQRELAALLEMDAAYLSRIENDKPNHTPEAATIGRVIKALNLERVEADRLFALAGKVPPDVLKKMLGKPELFERIRRA